jgi:hypothetical protein
MIDLSDLAKIQSWQWLNVGEQDESKKATWVNQAAFVWLYKFVGLQQLIRWPYAVTFKKKFEEGLRPTTGGSASVRLVRPSLRLHSLPASLCQNAYLTWPALLMTRGQTSRNPKPSLWTDGSRLKRYAERQYKAYSYQPPPRITRSEPLPGPTGSVAAALE